MNPLGHLSGAARGELCAKYFHPGAELVAYPELSDWCDELEAADVGRYIEAMSTAWPMAPASLSVHLPFCASRCRHCRHIAIAPPSDAAVSRYLGQLGVEIERLATMLGPRPVTRIDLAGGSPTQLTPRQLRWLVETLHSAFRVRAGAHLSARIDPRVTHLSHLRILAQSDFSELSVGVVDYNPATQRAIDRRQSIDATQAMLEQARRLGIANIALNLTCGLPGQTPETFAETINAIVAQAPNRIGLAWFHCDPATHAHQCALTEYGQPSADECVGLYAQAFGRLQDAGFPYAGGGQFAHSDDARTRARRMGRATFRRSLDGFSGQPDTDVFGLGLGAISMVDGLYAQNALTLDAHDRLVSQGGLPVERGLRLSTDDRVRRDVMCSLVFQGIVSTTQLEDRHNIVFDRYFASELAQLRAAEADGLVRVNRHDLHVTKVGAVFERYLCDLFNRRRRARGA